MSFLHINKQNLSRFFPIIDWLTTYKREDFSSDLFAGLITAILMIPQGIAYAILAGLPVQLGLYASVLPPMIYVLLGTSRSLSVGPVAVTAIMIASALNTPQISMLGNAPESALVLAAECGIVLLLMAVFRMGGLVNFISHPVLSGFTSGAAILIIVTQIPLSLGLKTPRCGFSTDCYVQYLHGINTTTLLLSCVVFAILLVFNSPLVAVLKKTGLKPSLVLSISKCGSLLAIIVTTVAIHFLDLATQNGVATIGFVPSGLPVIAFDFFNFPKWRALLPYAVFIALISFVESVALAKITAKYSGEKIIPNQELIALGFANIMAGISGAMPVAGGLSRTMVNYAAGAKTQIATLIAAIIVGFIVVFFSIWFAEIPKATLAVIILVSVFPLVRLKKIVQTFEYDSGDGMAETATFLGVIVLGIEQGIVLGIVITLISFLRKTSQPYIAILGRIEGTEQFRNIRRYEVETWEHLLLLRIDENISFANVSYVDDYLAEILNKQPEIRHIVLVLTAISDIDATGLEALEDLNRRFQKQNINMHLSDVKGPLLEKLKRTLFFEHLKPGEVFMCTNDAVEKLV